MRPSDTPQPVHKHAFRENLNDRARAEASPGPARYSGMGVTRFERDTKGGTFGKATRFKQGEAAPGMNISFEDRSLSTGGVGPKYTPKFNDTRIATSFSRTSHLTRERSNSTPGPGAYTSEMPWDKGVSIPNSYRAARPTSSTPGPGAYTPNKLPLRQRAAHIGGSSALDTSNAAIRKMDRPPLASLEAIDRSTQAIRSSSPAIGFTKAERRIVLTHGESHPNGAGAYNVASAYDVTARQVKGGKFSTSRRMPHTIPDTDGRLVALPSPDVTSNHASAPAIGFAKAGYKRGIPDEIKELADVPTAKYTPKYTAVDASVKGVVGWAKPKAGSDRIPVQQSPTANSDYIDARSTFTGPAVSFPESRRRDGRSSDVPGPGAYNPSLKAPKKEPRAAGFTKAKRALVSGSATEETPGPIYNPDVGACRAPGAPAISMGRSERKTAWHVPTDGPDASYEPKYTQVEKDPRAAIVYLTE